MAHRCSLLVLSMVLSCASGFADTKYDSRIARISLLEGHVSFQRSQDVEWSAASVNMALQPADRLYTGDDGRAEIQFDDGSVLRLAEKTDVELLSLREELIQLRILVGLSTLTVQSGIPFEINTPAAAFNASRKGVYRFDVRENGDTDAIVRKGVLEANNNNLSRRIESGELLHVTAGDRSTHSLSRYDVRDEWDEWNERRNADLMAYESRKYLPDYVHAGARELDRYGRWMVVEDYGPAWVPLYIDSGWSPYWHGRWFHRPFWGWTWVSYEPWGWLPYHYGRWHFSLNLGWCWLPGPSFGFHFWSPGLVRFYQGPGWVSWCPLGPGDYYNVNHYYFNRTYAYHLNALRLIQRRGPEELANRNIPGAFRTAGIDHFRNGSFGPERRAGTAETIDRPWIHGRLLNDQPRVDPTSRSFSPLPDRQASAPSSRTDRPVVIRSEPSVGESTKTRFSRITSPGLSPPPLTRSPEGISRQGRTDPQEPGRSASSSGETRSQQRARQPEEERRARPGIWNRRPLENLEAGTQNQGRQRPVAPSSGGTAVDPPRVYSRQVPGTTRYNNAPYSPSVPPQPSPSSPGRNERYTPEPRQPTMERSRPEPKPRSSESYGSVGAYTPRGYAPAYAGQGFRVERSPNAYSAVTPRPSYSQWQGPSGTQSRGAYTATPGGLGGSGFRGVGRGTAPGTHAPQPNYRNPNPAAMSRRDK